MPQSRLSLIISHRYARGFLCHLPSGVWGEQTSMKRHSTYLSRSRSSFTVPSRKERTRSFPTAFPVTMLNDLAIDSAYCYASHPGEKKNSGLGFLETLYRERKTGIRIFDDKSIGVSIEDIKNRIHAKMNLALFPSSVKGSPSLQSDCSRPLYPRRIPIPRGYSRSSLLSLYPE